MLIIDPAPPIIKIYSIESQGASEKIIPIPFDWNAIGSQLESGTISGPIVYVLHHGGMEFTNPVTKFHAVHLNAIEKVIDFFPEGNTLTHQAVSALQDRTSPLEQYILCETGFFSNIPDYANRYAIPSDFSDVGIHRYGGDGLCHYWASLQPEIRKIEKVISVHLGEHTTIASILNGKAIETSLGFSDLEGLPSHNGCGDIDPSIVLLLRSKGMSIDDIYHLLRYESGFKAIVQDVGNIGELLSEVSIPKKLVQELFTNRLLEQIGAAAAAMGGFNALVFTSENIQISANLINFLVASLSFLGIKQAKAPVEKLDLFLFSAIPSDIQVYGLNYDRCKALKELLAIH